MLTRAERIFIVLTHAFLTDPIAIFWATPSA